jgi:chromosome transmission fidelity protein 1
MYNGCAQVGRLLTNICTAAPDGVVAFTPSFAYMEQLVLRWTGTGMLAAMAKR